MPVPLLSSGRRIATYAVCLAALWLTACATTQSTQSGAIGLDRKQYFAEGSREAAVKRAKSDYNSILALGLVDMNLNPNPAQTRRVVDIANRLIPQVKHFRPEAEKWEWEVNVADEDEQNAFCMAGGKIIVYTGLINHYKMTDDEIAAVVGHEIAHALRDHTAEKLSTANRNNSIGDILAGIASIGIAATTGVNVSSTMQSAGRAGAQAIATMPNSREAEAEADLIGLELAARAGYDPRAAARFWLKSSTIDKADGASHEASIWSTHPSDDFRRANLAATEPKVMPLYVAAADTLRSQTAIASSKNPGSATGATPGASTDSAQAAKEQKKTASTKKTAGKNGKTKGAAQ